MLVSIVIPCYNSEATIEKVVEMVMAEFEKWPDASCEFVLVNDNSRTGLLKRSVPFAENTKTSRASI